MRPALACLLLLAGLALAAGAQSYEYDYGYDGSYGADDAYADVDDYGYYADDGDEYYEDYGYYGDGDDALGYEEYYDEYYDDYDGLDAPQDCTLGAGGKVTLKNGTATCDVRLEGVDKAASPARLPGGLDGVYKLSGCHNGRPLYRRAGSPPGAERVLWYAELYGDWDISNGSKPSTDERDILLYGGDLEHHAVPLFVKHWKLGTDLLKAPPPRPGANGSAPAAANGSAPAPADDDEDGYSDVAARLVCADGKVVKPPAVNPAVVKSGLVLTPDEIEAKYKLIYERYGRRPDPNPALNFTFVVLLVLVGLSIVLAIPYLLVVRRRGAAAKGPAYQPVGTSFAQVIQQSKKKQSGHIN